MASSSVGVSECRSVGVSECRGVSRSVGVSECRSEAEAGADVVLGPGVTVRVRPGSLQTLVELEGLEGTVVAEHRGRWRVQMAGEDVAECDLRWELPLGLPGD
jgi:hypothetical protein